VGIVLVTGATSGLGRAVAGELAERGATVLVHGRDPERIERTVAELPGGARGYRADLSSLAEVRRLAEDVAANEERLDVLVNNAGVATRERQESADGIELDFAVNHLAGFVLTGMLLPLLERSAPARVVNVASAGQAPIDWDDPLLERGWDWFRAYARASSRRSGSRSSWPTGCRPGSQRPRCTPPRSWTRAWCARPSAAP
jgi:NAD(P)-dependent dehydrogenase (short-subunit alcohol dehydrogenase family)